jgi:type III secretion protein Q
MRELSTVVTHATGLLEAPQPEQSRATRTRLRPVQRITRAHLALAARPGLVAEAQTAMSALSGELSRQLGAKVKVAANVLDTVCHPWSHLARHGLFVLLELGAPACVAVLELDPRSVGLLLERVAGSQLASSAPSQLTRIEEAAFGWLTLSALAALGSTPFRERYQPRLLSFTLDRGAALERLDARLRHLAVRVQLELDGQCAEGRLLVPAAPLEAVLTRSAAEAPGPAAATLLDATLPARCRLGRTLLEADAARALRPGDVVVLPHVTAHDGLRGPARLLFPTFDLRGSLSPEGFTLTGVHPHALPLETPMSDFDASMPLDVEVELTRLRLPLHQLGQLKPGAVLPLQLSAAQQVTLRIGDKAVARAELVEVEGELGARVLSLL